MHALNNIKNLKPFVKWAGGKSAVLPHLIELVPEKISIYAEPFLGSGAMFFALDVQKAIINDTNTELMLSYEVIRDDLSELIMFLSTLAYDEKIYKELRDWDRRKTFFSKLPKVERVGRFIYLMKTCFNGLYRVNKQNFFNTPMGRYAKAPNIVDVNTLNACSEYLKSRDVTILNGDYSEILDYLDENSFVYLDPPFFPSSKTSNFTAFQQNAFLEEEQTRLYEFTRKLHERKIKFLLTNSDTDFIRNLYQKHAITQIKSAQRINVNLEKRSKMSSIAITNYDTKSFKLLNI